jgi:hypothetical protein
VFCCSCAVVSSPCLRNLIRSAGSTRESNGHAKPKNNNWKERWCLNQNWFTSSQVFTCSQQEPNQFCSTHLMHARATSVQLRPCSNQLYCKLEKTTPSKQRRQTTKQQLLTLTTTLLLATTVIVINDKS